MILIFLLAISPFALADVHPDCTEKPIDFEYFLELMKKAPDQQKFLDSIPKDTLQTFTLMDKSESPEASAISPIKPGVIRGSIDGKLMFRYVCDHSKAVSNKIQIIHFVNAKQPLEFIQCDFNLPPSDPHRCQKNMHNDLKCERCHDGPGLTGARWNWPEYPTWSKLRGGNDDIEGRNSREELAGDPCYGSLPWREQDPTGHYPYTTLHKPSDLSVRANLRITKALSRLQAQRLSESLSQNPSFQKTQYRWAMANVDCPDMGDSPNPFLLASPRDRTLFFQNEGVARYHEGSNFLTELTERDLLLAVVPSQFHKYLKPYTTVGNRYGSQYACIDEIASPLNIASLSPAVRNEMCAYLQKKQDEVDREPVRLSGGENKVNCDKEGPSTTASVQMLDIAAAARPLDITAVQRGRNVAQTACASCHGDPKKQPLRLFFQGEQSTRQKIQGDTHFLENVRKRLNDEGDPMPPFEQPALSTNQRIDLLFYLQSLSDK